MAKVILFGGGDGGGLIITADGVRPLPPFDPYVRAQIKAVSQLVVAIQGGEARESDRGELTTLATRLANLAVQQLEAIVGTLDEEASLIVMSDDDGGFVCGTTGKTPTPLPRPPKELPTLSNMLARGVIDQSMLTFVRKATEQGRSVEDVLEHPVEIASELGIELSERSAHDLQRLAPSRVSELEDPVAREIVTFFQRVLSDGRYVDSWAVRPAAVSKALDVELSNAAQERIIAAGAVFLPQQVGIVAFPWIVAIVVVAIVVDIIDEPEADVVDRSGQPKF